MNYISNLIKNCELALVAKPTKELKLNSIDKAPDLNGIKSAIYIVLDKSGNPRARSGIYNRLQLPRSHKPHGFHPDRRGLVMKWRSSVDSFLFRSNEAIFLHERTAASPSR